MKSDQPVIFVLGPSWYGEWASDFHHALLAAGADSRLIYTNAVGTINLSSSNASSTAFITKIKNAIRKVSPWFVEGVKKVLRWKAERKLLKEIHFPLKENRRVIILFLWTPPQAGILKKIKKTKAQLVLWQGEAPVRDPLWAPLFDYFDHIFVFDEMWKSLLPEAVRGRASTLPTAADPARYYPKEKNSRFACDVAFVGLYRDKRAETLEILKDYDLRIYGYEWEGGFGKFSWLKEKYHGVAAAAEVNEIFNNAKVLIGSIGMGVPGVIGETITQRTFEIPLSGGFQIGFYCPAAIPAFDNSIVMFKDKEELKKLVVYYLEHSDEREQLAQKTHAIALQKHTYLHRAQELLSVLGVR